MMHPENRIKSGEIDDTHMPIPSRHTMNLTMDTFKTVIRSSTLAGTQGSIVGECLVGAGLDEQVVGTITEGIAVIA